MLYQFGGNPMKEVSVIIVFRNEESYIKECISSIEEQFVDNKLQWELILVDGNSTDQSLEIAQDYLKTKSFDWQIIPNPKQILAAGWNIGIKAAKGRYVVRPDAHATLHQGYISKGIQTLISKSDVTAVGGLLETKAKGFWGNIIKVALSSKVGVGNSGFRTASKSDYADTAVYALYRREIFEKAGYFNENLVRHQDNDMHRRIKKAGGRFYRNVEMKADYYARDSVKKLFEQMYLIGYYLPDVMGNGALSLRHLAPFVFYFVFFIGLLLFALGFPIFSYLILIQMTLYMAIITMDSLFRIVKEKNPALMLNILIIPLMHICYALGTSFGFIRFISKKKTHD